MLQDAGAAAATSVALDDVELDQQKGGEKITTGKAFGKLPLLSESFMKLRKKNISSDIHALFTLNKAPSQSALRKTLTNLIETFPLFSSRPHFQSGLLGFWDFLRPSFLRRNRWKYNEDDVMNHVKRAEIEDGKENIEDYISKCMMDEMPERGGLWEVHVVQAASCCYMVWRISHAIGDGVILTKALLALCEEVTAPTKKSSAKKRKKKRINPFSVAFDGAKSVLKLSALPNMPGDAKTPVRVSSGKQLTCQKMFRFSNALSLAEAKAAAKRRCCTINDIITAAVSEAISKYCAEEGKAPRNMRMLTVTNLRALSAKKLENEVAKFKLGMGSNAFSYFFLRIPTGDDISLEKRLAICKARLNKLKASPEALVLLKMNESLRSLFGLRFVVNFNKFALSKITGYFSNLPGPSHQLSIAGEPIIGMCNAVVPSMFGIGVSILSYNGSIVISLSSEASVVKNPRRLIELSEIAFKKLIAVDS